MRSIDTSDVMATRGALDIFVAFLVIGATSFGGGVIAHLHTWLVVKRRWITDESFVELLTISQTLPGLKTVNFAILLGDRLSGTTGAAAALAGICLPGAVLMYFVGVMYDMERQRPLVEAALEGVAPAALGLILATTVKLGRASFARVDDLVFIALTVICVNALHLSILRTLIGIGLLAIAWYGVIGARRGRPE